MACGLLLTGLPGVGKTTVARALAAAIQAAGGSAVVIDGDVLRAGAEDLDFSPAGRARQAERALVAAQAALAAGAIPLVALVAPDAALRVRLRQHLPGLGEVLLVRAIPARPAWPGTTYEIGGADLALDGDAPLPTTMAVLRAFLAGRPSI